jgi:hypothetical protein
MVDEKDVVNQKGWNVYLCVGLTIFLTIITFTSSLYVTWLQIKLIILGLQKQKITIVASQDNIHLHGSW